MLVGGRHKVSAGFICRVGKCFVLFILQREEVEAVHWMDFAECVKAVAENTIKNCIAMEELEMINSLIS